VRLLRGLLLFKLGFWAGTFASAALLKRVLPSHGDEESDEVALVAIMSGIELRSRSRAFRGGSMFSWLGGIAVDLREVELAENARLDVHFGFRWYRNPRAGGLADRVERDLAWRAAWRSASRSPTTPTLRRSCSRGFSVFGGIAVGAKAGRRS
jgi:hypothetical protein